MEESNGEARTGRFCITRNWLIIWTISSCVVIIACYLIRPYAGFGDEFSVLVNAMNVISFTLATGLPLFLSVGIAFGTASAKKHISALLKSGKGPTNIFLRCLGETYALVLVFSISVTGLMFLEPQLLGVTFLEPRGTGFLIYLPSVLMATLVVSLLLTSIGVLFVMISDDAIMSTAMGCALTIGLATLVGWTSRDLWKSPTKGIAMLSPSHLARMLAGTVSNYIPEDETTFISYRYFGFTATLQSVLLTLAVFGGLVFISLIIARRIFEFNVSHWPSDVGQKRLEIWESEPSSKERNINSRLKRNRRKIVLVALVITMLTITSVAATSYTTNIVEATTIIFHKSPFGGENITLGRWYIFSCDAQPARYGLMNILYYMCSIEDWFLHDCPDKLTFYYAMLNMSSSDFQALNETSRRNLCISKNITMGDWGGGGRGTELGSSHGLYTFALKVVATENETLSGYLYCDLKIGQSSTPTF